MEKNTARIGLIFGMLLALVGGGQAPAPYYEGKTLRVIVAFAPRGGFDT
jgi:tripartite-type tricarboxylate transporter receptor subunit TctC